MLTLPALQPRPLGWPMGLAGLGIPFRWVCIEGPAGSVKRLAGPLRRALVDYLSEACAPGAPGHGMAAAEALIEEVEEVALPGAQIGGVALRDLVRADIPAAASFGLFLADRVLQTQRVLELLQVSSLVIQQRGAFSTYVYQCLIGGISPSLFAKVTGDLTPDRPDLVVLLSPGRSSAPDAEAYRNPPGHILQLCARNFAMVSTEGRSDDEVAAAVVGAIANRGLVVRLS